MFLSSLMARRALLPALAAALLGACAARADDPEPETIDRQFYAAAPDVIKTLHERGVANVGVLKFVVKVGDGPWLDNVGALNRSLADRLEVALVLALKPTDCLGVLAHASDDVAAANVSDLTHRTDKGRAAFFDPKSGLRFSRPWGDADEKFTADAFLTGEVRIKRDWSEINVALQMFDAKDPKELRIVKEFTAAPDLRTLTESGASFAAKSKGVKDKELQVAGRVPIQSNYEVTSPRVPDTTAQAPDKEQNDKKQRDDWDDLFKSSPVKLEVRYNGKVQEIRGGSVPEPQPSDVVTFRLENKGSEDYGVVLKVNGWNTIEKQTSDPLDCRKWVLKPTKSIVVEGFQKKQDAADSDKAERFEVKKPAEFNAFEVHYDERAVGTFSLTIFRGVKAGTDESAVVMNFEKHNQETKPVSKGTLDGQNGRPDSLMALQAALKADASPAKTALNGQKGLLGTGPTTDSPIDYIPFTPYPAPVYSGTIRYYEQK